MFIEVPLVEVAVKEPSYHTLVLNPSVHGAATHLTTTHTKMEQIPITMAIYIVYSPMFDNTTITIIITALVAVNAGLIGIFLMLREQAMIGDAISHAVLPGTVIAFLLKEQVLGNAKNGGSVFILTGAVLSAIMASLFITFLHEKLRISHGAAIGIGFSFFFTLGYVLRSKLAKHADLDLDCVLSGDLTTSHLKIWIWGNVNMGALAIYTLGTLLVCNLAFLYFCYPRLVITSFDEGFASSIGIHTHKWNRSFILLATINIVLFIRMVQIPLVLGFLVIPPATAFLLSDRIYTIILYSVVIAVAMSCLGFIVSSARDKGFSLSATVVAVGSLLFCTIFFLMLGEQQNRKKLVKK